jgi:hypothetical protein
MSMSAKATADDLFATQFHELCEHKIHMIRAAIEGLVYGAEKISTAKCRIFQVCLNRA